MSPETIYTQTTKMDSVGHIFFFLLVCAHRCKVIILEKEAINLRVRSLERGVREQTWEVLERRKERGEYCNYSSIKNVKKRVV